MVTKPPLDNAVDALFKSDAGVLADPYPLYARLRAESPIHRRDSLYPFYMVTRYKDVAAVLRDPRFSSDRDYGNRMVAALERLQEPLRAHGHAMRRFIGLTIRSADPPAHTRLRGVIHRGFTPRMVARLRDRIQQLADQLLDAAVVKGKMDIVAEFADPLPLAVIMEYLGVPGEDRERVLRWADGIAMFFNKRPEIEGSYRSLVEFTGYFGNLIAARRACPREDLLSMLAFAQEQEGRLTDEELVANVAQLVFAGHNSVATFIGNAVFALLRHPDQMCLLRSDPSLIASAVEELLRYESPDQATLRFATQDCEIDGRRVGAGQAVSLWFGSANRDPEQFPEPDRLDITRRENKHLSFAHGPHSCLGAVLARMEGQIAINTILRRLPDLRSASDTVQWQRNPSIRRLATLPVEFTPCPP